MACENLAIRFTHSIKMGRGERATFSHQASSLSRYGSLTPFAFIRLALKPSPLRDVIISHYRATANIIGNLMLRGKTFIHHLLSSAHSWVTVWYHKFQLFTRNVANASVLEASTSNFDGRASTIPQEHNSHYIHLDIRYSYGLKHRNLWLLKLKPLNLPWLRQRNK